MSTVELQGIHKRFDGQDVIRGVDLDVAAGEFCVFVGPSGCGKSTLLRIIAGLEEADLGTVRIGGKDVTDQPPRGRGVAMVFQSYALYPHMTVYRNIAFGLEVGGRVTRQDLDRKVREVAEVLELTPLLDRLPKQLSGGQRQRVAIGRAIVRDPQVFLMDEPLSNLDAMLRVQMRIEIARLHRATRSTMIYVTHDQVEAMTLGDKIVVLNGGRI
jgi:ABC-type sugar transport system ATPase subunit